MGAKFSCCKANQTPRASRHKSDGTKRRSKLQILNNHINNHLNRRSTSNLTANNHRNSFGTAGRRSSSLITDDIIIRTETGNNLQHISEREITSDELDTDPSTHPSAGPLFMQRSWVDAAETREKRKSHVNVSVTTKK